MEGGPVEQRRQEQGEDQLRVELDLGKPRDQGDAQPGEHQQHRLGDRGAAGQPDHHRDGREQADQQLKGLHDAATVAWPGRGRHPAPTRAFRPP